MDTVRHELPIHLVAKWKYIGHEWPIRMKYLCTTIAAGVHAPWGS